MARDSWRRSSRTIMRAFEHYYGLGEQRSYERVATELGVAPSTVKLWARSFGWRERLRRARSRSRA